MGLFETKIIVEYGYSIEKIIYLSKHNIQAHNLLELWKNNG